MMFNPTPIIDIDGEPLGCSAANLTRQQTVLDGLRFTWGRSAYLDHSRPTTATIRIFDPVNYWRDRIIGHDALGKRVRVYWHNPDDDDEPEYTIFRGRVAELAARVGYRIDRLAKQRGWFITLTCSDRTADTGNIAIPANDNWPPETALNRAIRLNNYHSNVSEIESTFFDPDYVGATMWGPDEPARNSLLEHLRVFYQSLGDTFTYRHDENVIRFVPRYLYGGELHLTQWPDSQVVTITPDDTEYDGQTYLGTTLSGCDLIDLDGDMVVSRANTVNQVQLDWRDRHESWNDWSTRVPSSLPQGTEQRTYQATSWLDDGVDLDPVAGKVLAKASFEGAMPPHPRLRWDVRDGFRTVDEAKRFTLPAELPGWAFVSGSRYVQWLQFPAPVFGFLGGVIEYEGGYWSFEATPQWVFVTSEPGNVAWEDLDNDLVVASPGYEPQTGELILDPGITMSDLVRVTDGTIKDNT